MDIVLGSKVLLKQENIIGVVVGFSQSTRSSLVYFRGNKSFHSSKNNRKLFSSEKGDIHMENLYLLGFNDGLWADEVYFYQTCDLKYLDQVFEGVEGCKEFFKELRESC